MRMEENTIHCHDQLDILDYIRADGLTPRGSYCGTRSGLEVISRSNIVTIQYTIGDLTADMPKELGFVAEYKTVGECIDLIDI